MTTLSLRTVIAALVCAVAAVPVAAGTADAASKHRRPKIKRVTATAKKKKPVAAVALIKPPAATAAPAPAAPAPGFTSVISIGGYVFYDLTYAEAVEAYQAAVAAAPGYTPPPVTSISVQTTVGGTVG